MAYKLAFVENPSGNPRGAWTRPSGKPAGTPLMVVTTKSMESMRGWLTFYYPDCKEAIDAANFQQLVETVKACRM